MHTSDIDDAIGPICIKEQSPMTQVFSGLIASTDARLFIVQQTMHMHEVLVCTYGSIDYNCINMLCSFASTSRCIYKKLNFSPALIKSHLPNRDYWSCLL